MEKSHRLFIRNLPLNITEDKLKEIFDEHGTISQIDIKEKLQNNETKIAFINIITTERQLNTCCRNVNTVVLGNNRISVQVAKESFLDRLKREREEAAAKHDIDQTPVFVDRPIEPINIKVPVPFSKPNVKKTFSDDCVESIKNEPAQIIGTIIPVQPATTLSTFDERYEDESCYDHKSAKSFNKTHENLNIKPKEKKIVSESEIKRLASLKKQRQAFKSKEQIIRNALKIVDSNRENKVIFDDTIDNYSNQNDCARKLSLFNNEDDEKEDDVNLNENFDATRKPKYQTIGGDERFKLDARFFENDNEPIEVVEDKFTNEKTMQLQILNDILGNPIAEKPIAEKAEKYIPGKSMNQMIRYDPNENNHRNYEIDNEEKMFVSKRKRKKNNEIVSEEPPPMPVSSEVFYTVSNTLADSLKTQGQGQFSLLKTFGSEILSGDKNEHYETQDILKKKGRFEPDFGNKNPFKYDSSDDEEGNLPDDENSVGKSDSKLTTKNIPLEQCDSFFFIGNDSRFRDTEEFFQSKSVSNKTFNTVRRELKEIVRSKIRNNARKNQPWKKKIGTKSRSK